MRTKSMDQRLLAKVHDLVADARAADSDGTITLQHYQEADKAISEALDDLSFFGRSGARSENGSDPLQWTEPHDQPPQETEDLAGAFDQAVGRFQAMAAGHTGPLQDLMLDPAKRTELKSLFVGIADEDLRQLLTEAQPTTTTRARSMSQSATVMPVGARGAGESTFGDYILSDSPFGGVEVATGCDPVTTRCQLREEHSDPEPSFMAIDTPRVQRMQEASTH